MSSLPDLCDHRVGAIDGQTGIGPTTGSGFAYRDTRDHRLGFWPSADPIVRLVWSAGQHIANR